MTDTRAPDRPPLLDCGLIMKGGVTSGVVYPAAIRALKDRFRFRSIGGASAGAIAAAAAAAAEWGRQRRGRGELPGHDAFAELEKMEGELQGPTFLRDRFVPDPSCAGLFRAFMAYLGSSASPAPPPPRRTAPIWKAEPGGWPRAMRELARAARSFGGLLVSAGRALEVTFAGAPLATLAGCLGGAWLMYPYAAAASRWVAGGTLATDVLALLGFLLVSVAGAATGGVVAGALQLIRLALRLERKGQLGYGICSGRSQRAGSIALTDWLHRRLNEVAGLPADGPSPTLQELHDVAGVDLNVITTNLTLAQPMVLPARRGARSFFFRKEEMERLFPPPVVRQLVDYGTKKATHQLRFKQGEEGELLLFPLGPDLPLIVATRLSLSFPVLLSAVRLYSFTQEAYEESGRGGTVDLVRHVEEHWFSDGGIASNFPIHLFDRWVPDRPTFGITLYDSPVRQVLGQQERLRTSGAPAPPEVDLPDPTGFERARPPRFAIDGLGDFLRAVFNTAQSYRDTLQSSLPSYRERIVQVFLRPDEGGLNLNMKPETIRGIIEKGELAGRLLRDRYVEKEKAAYSSGFREHQWVRLLVLLGQLESEAARVRQLGTGDELAALFEQLVAEQGSQGGTRPWYLSVHARAFQERMAGERPDLTPEQLREWWVSAARSRVGAFLRLVKDWERPERVFTLVPPSPEGVLRVTPEV